MNGSTPSKAGGDPAFHGVEWLQSGSQFTNVSEDARNMLFAQSAQAAPFGEGSPSSSLPLPVYKSGHGAFTGAHGVSVAASSPGVSNVHQRPFGEMLFTQGEKVPEEPFLGQGITPPMSDGQDFTNLMSHFIQPAKGSSAKHKLTFNPMQNMNAKEIEEQGNILVNLLRQEAFPVAPKQAKKKPGGASGRKAVKAEPKQGKGKGKQAVAKRTVSSAGKKAPTSVLPKQGSLSLSAVPGVVAAKEEGDEGPSETPESEMHDESFYKLLLQPPQRRRSAKSNAADPRLDPKIDPKKAKRILANRQSAARSKTKQRKHLEHLKNVHFALSDKKQSLMDEMGLLIHNSRQLEGENAHLLSQLQMLERNCKEHKDLYNRLKTELYTLSNAWEQNSAPGAGNSADTVQQLPLSANGTQCNGHDNKSNNDSLPPNSL